MLPCLQILQTYCLWFARRLQISYSNGSQSPNPVGLSDPVRVAIKLLARLSALLGRPDPLPKHFRSYPLPCANRAQNQAIPGILTHSSTQESNGFVQNWDKSQNCIKVQMFMGKMKVIHKPSETIGFGWFGVRMQPAACSLRRGRASQFKSCSPSADSSSDTKNTHF
jgi:hypothetical protein